MSGFPDIRLYKSNYTAEEATSISKEKGSIVFSSATKRLYVGKLQYGSDIQDIKWTPDNEHKKYTLEIQKVDPTKNISILWDNNENQQALYVTQNNKKTKVASLVVDVTKIKTANDIKAKNLKTGIDEVIINKGTNVQEALQTLARQFENNFIWQDWQEEE